MSTRQGGKKKPMKQPKKEIKELDDDDIKFQQKQIEEKKRLKEAQDRAKNPKGFVKK